MEIKFRRDTAFRKQFFVPDSFAHPAKMDAQLLIWIVERYSRAGETILDPMAGSGTTMLACTLSRLVVLVELEEKFCKMMRDNWGLVKMRPQLGYHISDCQIIQGDAKKLWGVLVDKIVTSPPYAESLQGELTVDDKRKARLRAAGYKDKQGMLSDGGYSQTFGGSYSDNPDNIGNLKPDSYLMAMLQVYSQCYQVLKPQGLMILVTKNFIRNKRVVRLDTDTIGLCEQAGFKFVERHYRKLPAQSFWRIIYHQKHPEVEQINHEDILVFRK